MGRPGNAGSHGVVGALGGPATGSRPQVDALVLICGALDGLERLRLPSTRQLSAAASRAFLILSKSLACGRPEVSERSILLQSRCAKTEFSTVLWPPSRFGVGECSSVGFQSLYSVSATKW